MRKILELVFPEDVAEWLALALLILCRALALAQRCRSRAKAERPLTGGGAPSCDMCGDEQNASSPQ